MQRTKSIPIKSIRLYKAGLALFFLGMVFNFVDNLFVYENWVIISLLVVALLVIIYYLNPGMSKSISRLKDLSYDDENLYIVEGELEEKIPFHKIRNVTLLDFDGLYQFNFFNKQLHDGAVRCKTSMWYPFNKRTVDKELNRVRGLIRKAHREHQDQLGNDRGLASFNG